MCRESISYMESRFFCYHFFVITFLLSFFKNLITKSGFSTPLLRARITARSNMKNIKSTRVGNEAQYDPRTAGEILHDYLENSSEPLAVAYRNRFHPNTELGVDLKLFTRKPGRIPVGGSINCILTRDDDYHYIAVENAIKRRMAEQRNPHVYVGRRINVHRKDNGTLYPTFNRPSYTKDFSFQNFCREAAEELLVVACLVEE